MSVSLDLGEDSTLNKAKESIDSTMSLSSKINLSNPVIREWLNKRKSTIRPIGTFFNSANFQVPPSAGRLSKRVYKNVEYFQSNYVLVFLLLWVYCLVTSPLLLVVMAAAGGACYFISVKNQEQKITVAGHEISLAGQYGLVLLCSIPLLLIAGAGGVVFWVLGASLFCISLHAGFYNYDALDVPEDQEPLTGTIVEEV
ncbi:prenylated Rab acceptor protein 1 [Eurytemora carolleeae]|uniref:prenylated Rab acceptor protein 1 n=1 Tax=Eurytemora carolleeae TaxID=1294199 RepID=UPI000C782470|nr:prenylated Rab acceptor protein 1 [Eurytemora carolleeae]|eukprot:XP_023345533.1 prenylated Rab acceptor protein 1-like [Eurytemora affinis]